jgi:hypothetical protein
MDRYATKFLPIVKKASWDFLKNSRPEFKPLSTGHIPLDADVTPMDNSRTRKEGVSRTYKGCDGFAPMAVYLGQEGYCIDLELREGKQHCQKGTPDLLANALNHARDITPLPILVRLDGGNDSIENIDVILEFNDQTQDRETVNFIIKWNPRQQDRESWLAHTEQQGRWSEPRAGKRVALFSISHERIWTLSACLPASSTPMHWCWVAACWRITCCAGSVKMGCWARVRRGVTRRSADGLKP